MKKKVIVAVVIAFSIITGIIVWGVVNSLLTVPNYDDRTDEEYISIFLDNRADFEYVATVMQQWDEGYIRIKAVNSYDDPASESRIRFPSDNQEIKDEISSNEEFYHHLANLFYLDEIRIIWIYQYNDHIVFEFKKVPSNYRINLCYVNDVDPGGFITTIDEHWVLEVLPNV